MRRQFTLEYWLDDGWYVGKLKEIPGIFSQGESLEELEQNIREAHQLMMAEEATEFRAGVQTKELEVDV
ncbi:type II toxin-antitoxin system HicB family antitoxin [bacterium]|nr:MAG: type II toxin-antitoxin system HicB family antitoxin [candidate division KSB1 bacterium]MCE7940153.1 type II toxin-antitoxin system HicB family antitoxin [Chlorobi bacterium CHB1]MCL4705790.1 type II toxin-antitoxin system HicB family antitoxin [bacterium]MDL1873550.1 type II toxin-antitoxin system HicB family antitoxin [Cytophagia bacterium CHB2]MBC6946969.1 type II toxin-antitoxin system HicB family antitoxin [candidate division KSB1 bacterium]